MSFAAEQWQYETKRLRVLPWRVHGDAVLLDFLSTALTERVTRDLPPTWQRPLDAICTVAWLDGRDAEGQMFLVEERDSGRPAGLFMFFADGPASDAREVRLGYVLAESCWGQGFATEVVEGFLSKWDAVRPDAQLLAGVTTDNSASQRVLEKTGFRRCDEHEGVLTYRRDHSVDAAT